MKCWVRDVLELVFGSLLCVGVVVNVVCVCKYICIGLCELYSGFWESVWFCCCV